MCEYVSFVCTTNGPLNLYVSPTMTSHGDARLGWKIKGGAEAEWTGEGHDSLTVRFEDDKVAKTIRQMLVEKFRSRTELVNSIAEARDSNGNPVFLKGGKRVFCESDAGPNFEELNALLDALPTLPYSNPTEECCDELLEQLVAQHLYELGTYCKDMHLFDGVTLKVVRDPAARAAARAAASAAASAADWAAASDAARDAADWAAASAAASAAAWAAARDAAASAAARAAARDAARDAAHLVSGIGHNPWAPLIEIWALGAVPIGVIDDEFVVYVGKP